MQRDFVRADPIGDGVVRTLPVASLQFVRRITMPGTPSGPTTGELLRKPFIYWFTTPVAVSLLGFRSLNRRGDFHTASVTGLCESKLEF